MNFFSSDFIPGSLSVDRITFLVFCPRLSLWSENEQETRQNMDNIEKFSSFLELRLSSVLDMDYPQGCSTVLYKKHYRTIGGVDIQFGPVFPVRKKRKLKEDDYKEEEKYIYQPSYYSLRIEYNPNKDTLSDVKPLFSFIKNFSIERTVVVSRLDIAIDYVASINPELILCRGIKKNCVYGGVHGVETVYFGRRTSSNMFRIYNKRQEIIDSGETDPGKDIWRVELEHAKNFPLSETPDLGPVFDKLTFLPGCMVSNLENDWIMQILLENALHNGSLQNTLNKIPRSTRLRYLQKISEYEKQSKALEDPSYVFRRDFSSVFNRCRTEIIELFAKKVSII